MSEKKLVRDIEVGGGALGNWTKVIIFTGLAFLAGGMALGFFSLLMNAFVHQPVN